MTFSARLAEGRVAEGLIASWLRARGNAVLPVYEIEKSSGKGPQLFAPLEGLIAPDMVCFTDSGVMWIEAKHKSVFTWHRNTRQWTTGIDVKHYGDYLRVGKQTKLPVWLMFFHRESQPSEADRRMGCPETCPVGLFGGDLFHLVTEENHRAPALDHARDGMLGHGRSGMVYWAHGKLKLLATRECVFSATNYAEAANA